MERFRATVLGRDTGGTSLNSDPALHDPTLRKTLPFGHRTGRTYDVGWSREGPSVREKRTKMFKPFCRKVRIRDHHWDGPKLGPTD